MIRPFDWRLYSGRSFRLGMNIFFVPWWLNWLPWRLAYTLTVLLCKPDN